MATKTAGTLTSTGLTALQWQPGGLNQTDLATINELIYTYGAGQTRKRSSYVENGILFIPGRSFSDEWITLNAGDWIVVDSSTGWPIVIPSLVMTNSTVWTHS